MDTNIITTGFVEKSKEILQENLVGIYLHGSAVMGCYNPAKGIEMSVVKQSVCRCADTGLYRFHLGRYCKCKR